MRGCFGASSLSGPTASGALRLACLVLAMLSAGGGWGWLEAAMVFLGATSLFEWPNACKPAKPRQTTRNARAATSPTRLSSHAPSHIQTRAPGPQSIENAVDGFSRPAMHSRDAALPQATRSTGRVALRTHQHTTHHRLFPSQSALISASSHNKQQYRISD